MKARALLHGWRAAAPAARARGGWRAEVPYLALLLGAYVLPLALVSPRGEFGLVDGWCPGRKVCLPDLFATSVHGCRHRMWSSSSQESGTLAAMEDPPSTAASSPIYG
jgi:hypothetical protein